MKTRQLAAAAVASALLLGACGGSSGQARDAEGVRDAFRAMTHAQVAGDGAAACQHLTAEARAMADAFGGCAQLLGDVDPERLPSDEQIAAMPVSVDGDAASYEPPDGSSGRAVYDGGQWQFDLDR